METPLLSGCGNNWNNYYWIILKEIAKLERQNIKSRFHTCCSTPLSSQFLLSNIAVHVHSSACTNCHLVKRNCNQEAAEGGTVHPILLLMHLAFKTQTKNITYHMSVVTCHVSRITCHMSPVTNGNSHSHRPSPLTPLRTVG